MAPVWLVERFFAKAKCFALTDSPHPDTKRCCVQFDTAPMAYSLSFYGLEGVMVDLSNSFGSILTVTVMTFVELTVNLEEPYMRVSLFPFSLTGGDMIFKS